MPRGTRTPAAAAIQAASLPTNRMSNRPAGNSSPATRSRSAGAEQVGAGPLELAR